MARLRDRIVQTAAARGELVLYKLDRPTEILCPLHGSLHYPLDRHMRRRLDKTVVQVLLPGHARLGAFHDCTG